jgi:REP element-mobilizing transposase RayT
VPTLLPLAFSLVFLPTSPSFSRFLLPPSLSPRPLHLTQNRDREGADENIPLSRTLAFVATYLITFCCYGHHFPGQLGSVDARHNQFGSRLQEPQPLLERWHRSSAGKAFRLTASQRAIVCQAIVAACRYKRWPLLAVHVRSTHVHIVVAGDPKPESMMNALKSYASRAMNRRRCWARHGSTRYLWSKESVDAAVIYVLDRQGERMAWYEEVPHTEPRSAPFTQNRDCGGADISPISSTTSRFTRPLNSTPSPITEPEDPT